MANDIKIYGAVRAMTEDGKAAYAEQVYDSSKGKFQSTINSEMETGKQDVIPDLNAIRAGAAAGATAAQPSDLTNFVTKNVNDLVNYYLKSETYTKTEVQALISAVKQFTYQVVAELPTASASTMNIIYLVPSADPQQQNVKDEFITIATTSGGTTTYSWEQIGSTAIDLSGYYTSAQTDAAITAALNTALASYYTSTQVDAAITTALGNYYTKTQTDTLLAAKEAVANKVTTIDGDSTDTQYPSAKAVHGFVEEEIDGAKEDIDVKLDGKANNDGYYGEMTVGSAENLVGRGTVGADYNGVRTTAGTEDIGSGSATITKYKGNSVKFNQLISNGNFANGTTGWGGAGSSVSVSQNELTATILESATGTNIGVRQTSSFPANHKYYLHVFIKTNDSTSGNVFCGLQGSTYAARVEGINNSYVKVHVIVSPTVATTYFYVGQLNARVGVVLNIKNAFCIDLTQIFGKGNEPATVEEFEEWLAENVGKRDYYPYTAGAILNNGATGIKTRGFNLYDYATGKAYLCGSYSDYEWEYEICGTFESISYTDVNGNTYVPELHDGRFFNVENAGELTVVGGNNTDTLVHMVWSGWRNEGEPDYAYEPYWESLLQLNLKTITGKLNGTGESQVIFPYGLAKIGNVQDEIVGNVANKRIGRRAYEQGDESDSTVMTDGTNTQYVLSAPEIYILDEELPMNYRVDDFGTEEAEPAYTDELNANIRYDVQYAMNAVDAIRRLPTNYVQREDVKQLTGKSEKFVLSQKAVDDNYAKKVGIEKDLTAGSAMNLQGDDVNNNNDLYRKTGGNNSVSTGIAQIEGIKGDTIVWNSVVKQGQKSLGVTATLTNGVFECSGTTTSVYSNCVVLGSGSMIVGHKYYMRRFIVANPNNLSFSVGTLNQAVGSIGSRGIFTARSTQTGCGISGTTANTDFTGVKFTIAIFNLTLIYGEGNEPTTPEQFEADYFKWFGKPLTYEPYDAGSLRPTMIDGLKITGFNQYNPESGLIKAMIGEQYQITGTYTKVWESDKESMTFSEYTYGNEFESGLGYSINGVHYISERDASAYSNEQVYSLNSYCIHENQVYKCNTAIDTAEEWDATHWDLIADVAAMVTEGIFVPMDITPDSNGIFTPTKFYVHVEGGNATDTCVHLVGDGARNGEYEQYKEQNTSIPVSTLTGKLNGQGESVVVFPDGLKKVGDVADEIVIRNGKTIAIKRIGVVDLGSLTYVKGTRQDSVYYESDNFYFPTTIVGYTASDAVAARYALSSQYSMTPDRAIEIATAAETKNLYIGIPSNAHYYDSNRIRKLRIKNNSYSTAESIKGSLAGQYLYYVIQSTDVKEYILDDFQLPISIQADALGTEEQTIPSGVASAPAQIGIKYAIDAVGFILNAPKNYISEQSMDNFLSQLGTAMNGTWTKTWNESSGEYNFSFTPNVEPEP